MPKQELSVIVPCYNEEAVLAETHRRLTAVLGDLDDLDYEIVYVDDSWKVSRELAARLTQRGAAPLESSA